MQSAHSQDPENAAPFRNFETKNESHFSECFCKDRSAQYFFIHGSPSVLLIPDDSLLHFTLIKNSPNQAKQDIFHLG